MNTPLGPALRLARGLHGIVEREDVPPPEVRRVVLSSGVEAVRVCWPLLERQVVVTFRPGEFGTLACHRGFAKVWTRDLRRGGVDSLRRALAWLVGEVEYPEAR